MKKLLILSFLFLFSSGALSEEYVCSGIFNLGTDIEIKTYTRSGNHFNKVTQWGEERVGINHETKDFIILTGTYQYPSVFVTIIDKNNKIFMEHYIQFSEKNAIKPLTGACLVKH